MERLFIQYLLTKKVIVHTAKEVQPNAEEVRFALAQLFGIHAEGEWEYLTLDNIQVLEEELARFVPEPFYRNFPDSVKKLPAFALYLDQKFHYLQTYGLGDFSGGSHSLLEEPFERTAFKEDVTPERYTVVSEEEAERMIDEIVKDLLVSTRPLAENSYGIVCLYAKLHRLPCIASKEMCARLLVELRDLDLVRFLSLADFIKVVRQLQYRVYSSEKIKELNLRNQDRKFLTKVLDRMLERGEDFTACYEQKANWNGILHHIHYKAKSEYAQSFLDAMRGSENKSFHSRFEQEMEKRNVIGAAKLLAERGTADYLRNLNYLLSRCKTEEETRFVLDHVDGSLLVLLQLYLANHKEEQELRTFRFVRFEHMISHQETEKERSHRKSSLSLKQKGVVSDMLLGLIEKKLKGKLGKVFISPDMENIALPIQESTTSGGLGVLPKGSKLPIPKDKKIRAFTYWEKVNDIDLSCFGIMDDGKTEEFSWRTMCEKQGNGICFSGDVTDGFYGGSEYFDIDLKEIKKDYGTLRYLVFCNNVFSSNTFKECFCKAGYMLRSRNDSGMVYEPKTVKSSFTINSDSDFAYLFAIDLRTSEFIWLNTTIGNSVNVAGESDLHLLLDYLTVTKYMNMKTFFEMAATEIVISPKDADIIVSDHVYDTTAEQIHSYDFEKVLAIMNEKI